MVRALNIHPRVKAPWLLEVKPVGWRPDTAMRASVEYAPGIAWDGLCGCWIVPVELKQDVIDIIETKE